MPMNMNSGYVGWSMSVRASEAYRGGEMPKSKWTKRAILGAIYDELRGLLEEDRIAYLMRGFSRMTKDSLFSKFFYPSSWHHTSKFANPTDFYSLDYQDLWQFVREIFPEEN